MWFGDLSFIIVLPVLLNKCPDVNSLLKIVFNLFFSSTKSNYMSSISFLYNLVIKPTYNGDFILPSILKL